MTEVCVKAEELMKVSKITAGLVSLLKFFTGVQKIVTFWAPGQTFGKSLCMSSNIHWQQLQSASSAL
jgi:hypothetical protein